MSTNIDQDGEWYAYEKGGTLGKIGPEGGIVLRDEEFGDPGEPEDADARLILEQGRVENPGFFVTANLYGGWLYHITRRDTKAEADALYDTIRPELETLAGLIPLEDDKDVQGRTRDLLEAASAFERRFA